MPGKICATCGHTYYRSNRYRLWIQRNPGHRDGNVKIEESQCLDCATAAVTAKLYRLATFVPVQVASKNGRSLKRRRAS